MKLFRSIRTVASITASLTALVNDLEQHAEDRLTAHEDSLAESARLAKEAEEHHAEMVKANEVAGRLRALIG